MANDLVGSVVIISFVGLFLIISEILARKGILSNEGARKLIHISVGNIIFFVPLFENRLLVTAIPLVFVFGNVFLSPVSPIEKLRLKTFDAGHAFGTIFYPLSLSIVIYFGFDNLWIALAAFFTVVWGDGLAAVTGPKAKSGHFKIYGVTKTLIGTLTVSFASWLSVFLGILILGESLGLAIIVASLVAILAPIVELISPKGTDNLFMPPVIFLILYLLKDQIFLAITSVNPTIFFISIALGAFIAILGYKARVLTVDGALAGFLQAVIMLGLTGWMFGSQLFMFFIFGTLATKIIGSRRKDKQDEFEKGSEKRDSKQALAKAGMPAIIAVAYILYPSEILFYVFSGIFAASLIDTMSTEIGIAFQGTTRPILKPWKKAEQGEAGAISLSGTLGGFLSGLVFTSIVYLISLVDNMNEISSLLFIPLVTIAGTLGMFSDSILGSTVQRMNRCVECSKILEADIHHDKPTEYYRGIKFFKNDLVNLLGTSIGGIFGLLFYFLFLS